jgi:hypothetical protein
MYLGRVVLFTSVVNYKSAEKLQKCCKRGPEEDPGQG